MPRRLFVAEDIADSPDGADEGFTAAGFDLAAESIDVDVDDVGVRLDAHAPDLVEDHGAADDAAGIAAEEFEQRELVGGELELFVPSGGLAAEEIEAEIEDLEDGDIVNGRGVAADEVAEAGEEFRSGEGLDEVVVAAGFQAADAIVDGAASGEDEDGGAEALLLETGDEGEAVFVGQAEVEDDGTEVDGGAEDALSSGSRGSERDFVTAFRQGLLKEAAILYIIFYNEQAHLFLSVPGPGEGWGVRPVTGLTIFRWNQRA